MHYIRNHTGQAIGYQIKGALYRETIQGINSVGRIVVANNGHSSCIRIEAFKTE